MRTLIVAAALGAVLSNAALAHASTEPALQPTTFETFVGRPATKITWSENVGRIDSGESHVVVTALTAEDVARPTYRMRGVRIDLANARATDQVFLSEPRLGRTEKALDEIEADLPRYASAPPSNVPYRYFGAAEFWHPDFRIHTLNAAYYIAPDSRGLSLSAYNSQEFRLPDHRPGELAALIRRAIDELARH